ncbi:MAG: 4Fe-4S binding protein, partial [Clostridia bacterium]|nr:4Fe-4S binding protein [Clostridia bacterium]
DKCIECGQCAKVCPFFAIVNNKRPCQVACKVKAISITKEKSASIDNDKCIYCGACGYQCPFGAISEKSFILEAIDIIKKSNNNTNYKVYAMIAPAIASQLTYATLGQIISGIKVLGFDTVIETALGADMVAYSESRELEQKGFLTSSCCPAFVEYVKKHFPDLLSLVSHNPSPMTVLAKYIKQNDPTAKVIFIGPCTAKKMEMLKEDVKNYVDSVLTFEELQALFDSRDIDLESFEECELDNASYFGRIFARSGGLAEAVAQAIKEQDIDFDFRPVVCDGIEQCRIALLKKANGKLDENFIEGMACINGCIGGAGCVTHIERNKSGVDNYANKATRKTIKQ